jgi:amino acid adenylation domain-containing protein
MTEVAGAQTPVSIGCSRVRPALNTRAHIPFASDDVEGCIPACFERQVQVYPAHVAVQTGRHTLTYETLNQAANRVARTVLANVEGGVGRVGLLLAYDAELIIGLLASLKAGKAYIPLDEMHPKARSMQVLDDSQAQVVLTDTAHLALAMELARGRVPVIDIDNVGQNVVADNLQLSIAPDSPAYILYTSGSTGSPKGVVQTHRNILHCMMWYTNRLCVNCEDRLSLTFPSTYALAAVVTFTTLLNGAGLFPCNVRERGIDVLREWLQIERITIHHTVPAVFRHFARTLTGREQWPALRLICLGGDAAYRADFELYQKHFPPTCSFLHEFGATEALICCVLLLEHGAELRGGIVPAGYPGDDVRILILGEDGRELGKNEVGQLAIKSRYLTPGYWQRPELTEAAFLADTEGSGERTYLTGDLGRIRPDGALEHLGRTDFRVKVRGQTVEVAEIETALLAAPVVKEAVVALDAEQPGEAALVAYLTLHPGPVPTATELRELLSQQLPMHMIPATFKLLDAIPLSPNGKVDRRALPSLPGARLGQDHAFRSPRTSSEEALVASWKELLGLDTVGVYDDFFELGGDSLSAARVISQVHYTLGVEVPLVRFFEAPTIAELAEVIEEIKRRGGVSQQPTLAPISREAHRVKGSAGRRTDADAR